MPLSIILKSTISYIFESIRFRKKNQYFSDRNHPKPQKILNHAILPHFKRALKFTTADKAEPFQPHRNSNVRIFQPPSSGVWAILHEAPTPRGIPYTQPVRMQYASEERDPKAGTWEIISRLRLHILSRVRPDWAAAAIAVQFALTAAHGLEGLARVFVPWCRHSSVYPAMRSVCLFIVERSGFVRDRRDRYAECAFFKLFQFSAGDEIRERWKVTTVSYVRTPDL